MLEILKKDDMLEIYVENFKTSYCWLIAFLRRYRLALQQHTHIFQKLSSKTQESLEKFVTHLQLEKLFKLENISQLMIRYANYLNNGKRMENCTQGRPAMLVYDSFIR